MRFGGTRRDYVVIDRLPCRAAFDGSNKSSIFNVRPLNTMAKGMKFAVLVALGVCKAESDAW